MTEPETGPMPQSWIISVGGRTYGPFTADQMQAFAAEGRLVAHSLIARNGEAAFGPAAQDPALASIFMSSSPSPAFEAEHSAGVAAEMKTPQSQLEERSAFGRNDDRGEGDESSHFVIVADMKSRSIAGLEEEIHSLGPAYAITPQTWVLSSELSVNAIRNILIQKLGKLDVIFVIDATNDKIAWFNYSPEQEVRVRRVWNKAAPILTHSFG
jgi:hypothetical protein